MTTILWSIGLPLGALLPNAAQAAVSVDQVIPGSTENLSGSVANRSLFGLNLAVSSGETLSSVRVVLGARSGEFAAADLAAMGTGAGSGLALYKDNKAAGTYGSLDGSDTVVTITSPTLAASRFAKATPTATAAVTDSSMILYVGDVAYANTGSYYSWHMVTTAATGVSTPSLRLDSNTSSSTFASGSQFSKFTPTTTGTYIINGASNTMTPTLSAGDLIYYHNISSPGSGMWGVLTQALSANVFQVNGQSVSNGTYIVGKFSSTFGAFTVPSSGTITVTGTYSAPAVGDMVFYAGNNSAGWGVVTNQTLTTGSFAINDVPLASPQTGNYIISRWTGFSQTSAVVDGSLATTAGDVGLSYTTMDPSAGGNYSWHMVTASANINSSSLRLDGTQASPRWAWFAKLTPGSGQALPANDSSNNAGADYFVTVSTAPSPTAGHNFSLGVGAGDVQLSAGVSTMAYINAGFAQIQTGAPTISTVTGFATSTTLNVKFNKPVQRYSCSSNCGLTSTDFTFVDNGTTTGHTISSVTHTAGYDYATITLSGVLDAEDFINTPSTLAAASSIKIVDMYSNAMGTGAVSLTSPLTITSSTLPAATVGTAYTTTLTFAGGTGTLNVSTPWSVLSGSLPTGLTLNQNSTITGTPTTAGTFSFTIKVRDNNSTPNEATLFFTMSVGSSGGGGTPYITMVSPGALSVSSSNVTVTITGTNTHFSTGSVVSFSGSNVTVGAVIGTPTNTSISVPVSIASGAATGMRDVTVTTASPSEAVTMTNGFTVLSGSSYGLALQAPTNGATGVSLPPSFNFSPSTNPNGTVQSYEIIVKADGAFTGTTYWDYAFPTPAVDAASHCSSSTCSLTYMSGYYRTVVTPIPLAPNTTYYWQVKTYNAPLCSISPASSGCTATTPIESTNIYSFTTGSVIDNMPPEIQHRPVMQLVPSADRTIIARVGDNVSTPTSTPALTTSLVYCNTSNSCTPGTSISGVYVAAGYWKYTIPNANIPAATGYIRYYLTASDGTFTTNFKQPDGTTPFTLTTVAAVTTHKLAGAVTDQAAACLAGVYVFAEGTSFNNISGATSCAGGTYSLGSIPPGNYDLVAFKEGYGDRRLSGVYAVVTADGTTTYNFSLTSGAYGGGSGSFSRPHVKWSGPPDNTSGIPGAQAGFKIFVAFDRAMSSSSVTMPGTILLKKFSGSTDETGSSGTINGTTVSGTLSASIAYYPQNTDINIGPTESNLAVITPTASFGDGKNIVVIVTPGVTDTSANPLEGNQPDGAYVFTFSTGSTYTPGGGGGGGGSGTCTYNCGAFTAPYVVGTTPKPGSFSVPLNTKLAVTFSQAMDGTSLNASTVKLYSVSGLSEILLTTSNYTLDTTNTVLIFTPSSTLTASLQYRIKVFGGAKSATGVTLAPPSNVSIMMFQADFNAGTTSDTGAPTKLGSYPDNNATSVPVNSGAIMVAFSKPLDPSTITSSNVSLAIGSTTVNGTVKYDDTKNAIMFLPSVALSTTTTYSLKITTGVAGLNGTPIGSMQIINFTTGAADTVLPTISFANGNDYSIAVTFSEPMLAVKSTDTNNFGNSVLNPAKYTLNSVSLPASVVMRYEAERTTVMIEGLALTSTSTFTLAVTGVKDLSGNTISGTPSVGGTVQSSATTTVLGPGVTSGGSFSGPTGPNYTSSGIGYMPPAMVRPFNTGAGVTTIYGVEIPIAKQIPATTGKIVINFPVGFDVSGAKKDPNSPPNNDINGPGLGTVVFGTAAESSGGASNDGVTVDAIARTVTVTLGAVATRSENSDTHDYLRLDIAGIKNTTVPMDFGTSGYTVDVKTYSSTTLLDSTVSQPFFIGASGSYKIDVTVTTASAVTGTLKVYAGSPMTGMQDQTVTFTNGTSSTVASFTGLSDGQYMVFTDSIFIDTVPDPDDEWSGQAVPTSVNIAGGNATKTITLTKLTGAASSVDVTVYVKGPANEPVEAFASSPSGFARKKVTLDATATNYDTITLRLAKGQKWYIGVGPQMPDMSMSGPPPAPSYMPPKPWEVTIASGGTFKEDSIDATAGDAAVNDGKITFVLQSASLEINGTVQDGAGNALANAEVYASNTQAGFGTHTQSNAQGIYKLKVIAGSYSVGAFVPGMPSGQMLSVEVKADGYVFVGGSSTATTNVIIKLAKPDYTISGKVSNGTTIINGASVYAYRTDGPGASGQALTDTQGAYTIYVSNGNWKVGAFVPGYGQLPEKSLTVSSASLTNQNFAPTTGDFGTISGTITRGGVGALSGVFVNVQGNSTGGTFTMNDTATASDGTYSFKVPAGTNYTIRAFKPGEGQLPAINNVTVTAGGTTAGQDIAVTALNAITFTFSGTVTQAFVDMYSSSTSVGNHAEVKNGTTTILSLPSGTYSVKVFVPGVNAAGLTLSSSTGAITGTVAVGSDAVVNGAETITVTLPTLRTVSGTVYKTAATGGNELDKAWVEVINDTTGVRTGGLSAANGTFSLQVPEATYKIQAMKPGYSVAPATLTVSGNSTGNNIILSASAYIVSGRVKIGSVGASRAFVRAERVGATTIVGTQADANGDYTLYLPTGTWRVYGVAEGYQEAEFTTSLIAGSTASIDITLSSTVTLKPPKSKPITPAQGGELIDTDAGVKLTVPASAFGSSTSSGQVQAKETNNVGRSSTAKIAGNKAKEIQATDSSGNPITNLSGSVTLEMNYTLDDLTAAGIATSDESKLNLAYWDDTANNWVNVPATLDTGTKTLRGNTDHLTVFAIVLPFMATPAAAAGQTTGGTTGGGGGISSGFTNTSSTFTINSGAASTASSTVSLNLSSTSAVQVAISESPDFSGAAWQAFAPTISYTLSSGSGLKTVYVKYRDVNGTASSRLSANISLSTGAVAQLPTPVPVTEQQIGQISNEGQQIKVSTADAAAQAVGKVRDLKLEKKYNTSYVVRLATKYTPAAARTALLNFLTYGTPTTVKMSVDDRFSVAQSFLTAFARLPRTEADWQDVVRIANGVTPVQRNKSREKTMATTFKKLYKRAPNLTNSGDAYAVAILAYGLKPARDLAAEQLALKSFKTVYKKSPRTSSDWDIVRALAYSGVTK